MAFIKNVQQLGTDFIYEVCDNSPCQEGERDHRVYTFGTGPVWDVDALGQPVLSVETPMTAERMTAEIDRLETPRPAPTDRPDLIRPLRR